MIKNSIELKHVFKKYQAPTSFFAPKKENPFVLQDINLKIAPGEFHIFLGRSGCGKSTLLNIIAGFLPKTSGQVLVNGHEVAAPGRDRGVVFQNADAAIFPWLTVYENVSYGLKMQHFSEKERTPIVNQSLKLVGLDQHANKYPYELSGGMKQRVQIARSISNDPDILILDEPFGALDAQTRRIMQDELIRIWQKTKKTILFVTHDIQEAAYLGQKISIFSPAPASNIYKTITVDHPYPRNVFSKDNEQLVTELNNYFPIGGR
ncbi:ABC transporter ATP-binding protein [Liquorilactobacillus mali]|uniref:ABC transporter ATP-binding protein n=1 Tax=Liquorilactobacillus mali TaxID=1618 RepID=UPI00234FE6B3|nr:ABC transporter ATP-binding protein [Liquorilactobacillus mali]MDC7953646.1 ABC transporter ATP-binding protein [Liquorilactobacillus mali]MDV7758516.1 ATP-binding cassette domain-containing protein [Liquorilactobacillus mali]